MVLAALSRALFSRVLIVVRGGGDLASGAIYRLHRAGFPVIVTELDAPLFVRRAVCYGEAIYSGSITIGGVTARRASSVEQGRRILESGEVAALADPDGLTLSELKPPVIVDARMEKVNLGTRLNDAPLVVALGPGFTAGVDCHVVVETNRGHDLGRAIYEGSAEPDTGEPGSIQDKTHSRVLRAPVSGHVQPAAAIGDTIEVNQVIARIEDVSIPAPFRGVLRGLIHERVLVTAGMKIGDLDPRARRENCFTISDKSLAVGGGVLEAVLAAPQVQSYLVQAGHETQSSL
jgi:xanthine dehydrogenase accessory factor